MRFEPAEDDGTNEINMTPIIDCVFLLLIFFLVATVLKKVDKELDVELPQAAHATDRKYTEQKLVVVGVDAEGGFYLDGQPVGLERLHARLGEIAQENPRQRVRIDGDKAASFQSLAHILDICSFEGLKNVGIHTKSPERRGGR